MSLIYPRSFTASRASEVFTAQDGLHSVALVIVSNVPCSIQLKRTKGHSPVAFPAGTNTEAGMNTWRILCKLPLGTIMKGDEIVDDLGIRYEVISPYWNALGYNMEARLYLP